MAAYWQELAALSLVIAALGYLGWQGWRVLIRRKAGGCGGGSCGACPTKSGEASGKPFVEIGELKQTSKVG